MSLPEHTTLIMVCHPGQQCHLVMCKRALAKGINYIRLLKQEWHSLHEKKVKNNCWFPCVGIFFFIEVIIVLQINSTLLVVVKAYCMCANTTIDHRFSCTYEHQLPCKSSLRYVHSYQNLQGGLIVLVRSKLDCLFTSQNPLFCMTLFRMGWFSWYQIVQPHSWRQTCKKTLNDSREKMSWLCAEWLKTKLRSS